MGGRLAGTAVRGEDVDLGVVVIGAGGGAEPSGRGMANPSVRSGGTGSRTGDFTGTGPSGVVTPGATVPRGVPAEARDRGGGAPSGWDAPLRGAANDGAIGWGAGDPEVG
jgi:hypothetical protein